MKEIKSCLFIFTYLKIIIIIEFRNYNNRIIIIEYRIKIIEIENDLMKKFYIINLVLLNI